MSIAQKSAAAFEKTFTGTGMRPWEAFSVILDVWFVSTAIVAEENTRLPVVDYLQNTLDHALERFDRAGVERSVASDEVLKLTAAMVQHKGDFLGEVAAHLQTLNGKMGQYFTPHCIAELLIDIHDVEGGLYRKITENGYTTAYDPTAGSGALLISFANRVRKIGFDPKTRLFVRATDLDDQAFKMLYIQLANYDIPAEVRLGDTLEQEFRVRIFTPVYYSHFSKFPRRPKVALEVKDLVSLAS
mgnify:CR=1 FL=1